MKRLNTFNSYISESKADELFHEVNDDQYNVWVEDRKRSDFTKEDTLVILECKESYFETSKGGKTKLYFYKNEHKVEPSFTLTDYKVEDIYRMTDFWFKRDPYDKISISDSYKYIEVEKFYDEWYGVYCDSYETAGEHFYICDTLKGLEYIEDMLMKVNSSEEDQDFDDDIDESINSMGTLDIIDKETIEDLILGFIETWEIGENRFENRYYSLDYSRFYIYLTFKIDPSIFRGEVQKRRDFEKEMMGMIERIGKFEYVVSTLSFGERVRERVNVVMLTYFFSITRRDDKTGLILKESVDESFGSDDETLFRIRKDIDEVEDIFMIETSDWRSKQIELDSPYSMSHYINDNNSNLDFVWRIRPTSWLGIKKMEYSIVVDIEYNTELHGYISRPGSRLNGMTIQSLITDLFKFSKRCYQTLGLKPRGIYSPTISTMDFESFRRCVTAEGAGQFKLYLSYDDGIQNESSNYPEKIEKLDDNDLFGIQKLVDLRVRYKRQWFTKDQISEMESLLPLSEYNHYVNGMVTS